MPFVTHTHCLEYHNVKILPLLIHESNNYKKETKTRHFLCGSVRRSIRVTQYGKTQSKHI